MITLNLVTAMTARWSREYRQRGQKAKRLLQVVWFCHRENRGAYGETILRAILENRVGAYRRWKGVVHVECHTEVA
jgi:hypothetical protein